jgi:hypothetical protein
MKFFQETNAMDNRMRLSVQTAPTSDQKPTDVPPTAQTNTAKLTSTDDEVRKWSEKGRELSTQFYKSRAEADQKIVAEFRELRDKSKAVKKAFRDALNIESWETTRYRKVAEDDFLYEAETLEVFGELTISQQYELTKAPPDVKRSIREHVRTHPGDKSRAKLRELRLPAGTKQKPEAGSGTEQKLEVAGDTEQRPEADSISNLGSKLVEIWDSTGVSFDTMEEAVRDKFLSWLDTAPIPRSFKVIRFFEQGS